MSDAFFRPTAMFSRRLRGPGVRGTARLSTRAQRLPCGPRNRERRSDQRAAGRSIEILLTPLWIEARVVRPGRRVQFAEASLADERGDVARAGVWRIRRSDEPVPSARRPHCSTRRSTRRWSRHSSRPGRARATSRQSSGEEPPAPSLSRARQQCGCACESHWWKGRHPRR
jgi:hypothetical protein